MTSETSTAALPDHVSPAAAEKLRHLTPGTYCLHRSWGFGQVTEWDAATDSVTIDFKAKKGHVMQFTYAAESLTPLETSHVLVQMAVSPDELRRKAQENPVAVVADCIVSLGANASADGIQALLSPDIIPGAEYKKWWEGAKRALKKDGHFYIPSRKNEALRQLDAPSALGDSALENLRLANGPKAVLTALLAVAKYWPEIKNETIIDEIAALLDATLAKVPRSQYAMQVELALARDEFLTMAGRGPDQGSRSIVALVPPNPTSLSVLLDQLPGSRQPKLLESLKSGLPEAWPNLFLGLIPRANGRVGETITEFFQGAGREADVQAAVNRYIRERNVTCDFMYWLCKNRPAVYGSLVEPQLFMAILSVLEKDQLSEIKKGTKLYELLLSDRALLAAILKDAPVADVRDITRAILLSPVFEELDKRSLLAAIIKLYPDVQSMVVGTDKSAAPEAKIIVSWPSLKRREAELEDLDRNKIPQNSKDIAIARGYGDLRENHEFKSAKEMQTILARRKAELESMLARAEGTDFPVTDVSKVVLGTRVTLKDEQTGEETIYTILGAWDSDLSRGIISYQTAVAKALIGRPVGDVVELSTDEGKIRRVRIAKIEPHQVDLTVPNEA